MNEKDYGVERWEIRGDEEAEIREALAQAPEREPWTEEEIEDYFQQKNRRRERRERDLARKRRAG